MYEEGAGPFQDHLKQTKTDDMSKEEQQARINCEGLRRSTEQLENHRKLFLQMKETYQSVVKILLKGDAYNAICSKKLQGLLTAITAYEKQVRDYGSCSVIHTENIKKI
ncbi:hypothetical protein CDAR_107301 [Caerostris darwini]|uniref:Uncharacterized protein n=1 Tax=Caerostris darwini TaxID=1538125 RepID=A0AAV4NCR0_9ARAC|nr:hypothetical protein CDAR_107301 [Caerostris darwini]